MLLALAPVSGKRDSYPRPSVGVYIYFKDIENWHSRVPNPTWTHYRKLLTVSDETARHTKQRKSQKPQRKPITPLHHQMERPTQRNGEIASQ